MSGCDALAGGINGARAGACCAEGRGRAKRREKLLKSESIKELATALAKVRFGSIDRNKSVKVQTRTGGSYSFDYAPMETIMSAIRYPLAEQGLSLVQTWDEQTVETMMMHLSGEWISGRCPVTVGEYFDSKGGARKPTAQEVSSAITYARRGGVNLLCCLVADEDDDANIADGNTVQKITKPYAAAHKPTDGAFAALDADMQTAIFDLSNRIRSLAAKGDVKGCCDEVDETLSHYEGQNELKLALWEKLADVSAVRNAMKKEWEARKK